MPGGSPARMKKAPNVSTSGAERSGRNQNSSAAQRLSSIAIMESFP